MPVTIHILPTHPSLCVQLDEASLARLQDSRDSKSARLAAQQAKLQELQGRLQASQGELEEVGQQLAAKKEEAKAAQAEHRKTRWACGLQACGTSCTPCVHVCVLAAFDIKWSADFVRMMPAVVAAFAVTLDAQGLFRGCSCCMLPDHSTTPVCEGMSMAARQCSPGFAE